MKLNTILICVILWSFVEMISIVVSIFRRKSQSKNYEDKKTYVNRLLYYVEKKVPVDRILQELYFSLNGEKRLQTIVLKAMKQGNFTKALEYLEGKLGCEPVKLLHDYLRGNDDGTGLAYKVQNEIKIMDQARKEIRKTMWKNHFILIIEKIVFITLNYALYMTLKSDISLGIFIVVNTISVIIFIILAHDCASVEFNIRDGNLARGFWGKKRTQAPAARLKKLYQLLGALGLIVNISMLAAQYLEQVV